MPFRKKYSLFNLHMLGLLQGRAYRSLHTHLAAGLAPFGLSLTEWKALALVQDGFHSTTQLSQVLDVEPPLATRLIKQLEEKGFVKKQIQKTDRRASIISVTTKAKVTLPLINMAVGKVLYELMGGLSRDDIKTYVRVLETIVTNEQQATKTQPPILPSFQHALYEKPRKEVRT